MKPLFFRFVALAAFAAMLLSVAGTAAADTSGELTEAEARDVQAVVIAQFSAFAEDDADSAFATATPAVRESFGSPGLFLAVVRGLYPMVYQATSVTFHKPQSEDGHALQLVEIHDPSNGEDGKSWLAIFALERQPDMSWRISNCVVSENHWQPV